MKTKNISLAVIRLAYAGLPLAVELAKKRPIIGSDINRRRIKKLKSGAYHTQEISPEEALTDMGVQGISKLGKATHVLYDLKYMFSADIADIRL